VTADWALGKFCAQSDRGMVIELIFANFHVINKGSDNKANVLKV
jgi:hypothetical protein